MRALELRPSLELFLFDGSHPALAGCYLDACVLHRTLYDRSVRGNAFTAGLPARDATFCKK